MDVLRFAAEMHAESLSMIQGSPDRNELITMAIVDVDRLKPTPAQSEQLQKMAGKSRAFQLAFAHSLHYSHDWCDRLIDHRWKELEVYLNRLFDGDTYEDQLFLEE